ncbi:MAG: YARHG domain-containing protein [Trueperaceae bacterium]|nr:YARHG domain-containing protein [Trueperaceae bacterium]
MLKHSVLIFLLVMFGAAMSQTVGQVPIRGMSTQAVFFAQAPERTPSFDCSNATLWAETLICADNDLAALDRRIAAAYQATLGQLASGPAEELKAEQRAWIAERNGCEEAGGYLCLLRLMDARAEQLEAQQSTSASGIDLRVGRWGFTAIRAIVEADVAGLSCLDLSLMRNEIFARRGYIFNRPDYNSYFVAQSWYPPYEPVVDVSVHNQQVIEMLGSVEQANIDAILATETARGCR